PILCTQPTWTYPLARTHAHPYHPADTTPIHLEGETHPGPNAWDRTFLNAPAAVHPTQAALYNAQASAFRNLTAQITAADTQPNPTLAAQEYATAEQTAISLYMYVYAFQQTSFCIVEP